MIVTKTRWQKLLAWLSAVAAVIGAMAAFSSNVLSIRDNFQKFFGFVSAEVILHDASIELLAMPYFGDSRSGTISFTAVVSSIKPDRVLSCLGQGSAGSIWNLACTRFG